MTVQDYLRIFRERWIAIVTATLIGLATAGAVFVLQPSQYTAQLQMYVASPVPATSESSFLSAAELAQNRVKSYTEIATSPRVLSGAIDRLRLDMTPDQLRERVVAATTEETVVITIDVTDTSPERAASIANAIGSGLSTTVDDIERPQFPGAPVPVAVRAVQDAPVPTVQSSIDLKRLLAVGLLFGVAVGVAAALARNAMDNTVKSREQLAELVGAPSLGTVGYSSRMPKRPLAVVEDPLGPQAEDFKRLRTNIQFVDVGNPHKLFAITSALPGEGKTTTTVNLAAALASAGSRVLVVDADLRRPKAAELLGADPAVGFTSVLAQRLPAEDAVQPARSGRFDVLPSGPLPPNPSELLASRQASEALSRLRAKYDVVLVDTPPLLPVTDAAALAPFTDGAILVCRYQKTTRSQASAAAEALRTVGVDLRGAVLTMVEQSAHRLPTYGSDYRADSSFATLEPQASAPLSSDPTTQTMTVGAHARRQHAPSPRPNPRSGVAHHIAGNGE